MFYCQREPNPVWIAVNPKERSQPLSDPIMKSDEELCSSIEHIYEKYRPLFDNPLYDSFYSFVMEIISKGVCKSSIERLFVSISEIDDYKLKHVVGTHMAEVAELLLSDEEDQDAEYMQEILRRKIGRINCEELDETQKQAVDGIAADLQNQQFEYFEKVYQGTYQDQATQTQRKMFDFNSLEALTLHPFNISFISSAEKNIRCSHSDWKRTLNLSAIDCLSEIDCEGQGNIPAQHSSISFQSSRKSISRNQSIIISEKYIAPILVKEMKHESKITQQFANLVKEFGIENKQIKLQQKKKQQKQSLVTPEKLPITPTSRKSQVSTTIDLGNSSTKESMRTKESAMLKKINYKIQYDKKIKNATLMTRTNPYQIRRKL